MRTSASGVATNALMVLRLSSSSVMLKLKSEDNTTIRVATFATNHNITVLCGCAIMHDRVLKINHLFTTMMRDD